jgi:hypothetical protein
MMEEAASDKLLNASAMTEILLISSPINSFAANKSTLQQMPTVLAIRPYSVLTPISPVFS